MKFEIGTMNHGGTFHTASFFAGTDIPENPGVKSRDAMRRMTEMTGILQDGGYLGWQFSTEEPDRMQVFSGEHVEVSMEDYRWIYRELGIVEPEVSGTDAESAEKQGTDPQAHRSTKLYALREKQTEGSASNDTVNQNAYIELMKAMIKIGARIRVSAVHADHICGQILLVMDRAMPLRFRAMAAHAFPALEICELRDSTDAAPFLSQSALIDTAGALLQAFMMLSLKRPFEEYDVHSFKNHFLKLSKQPLQWPDFQMDESGPVHVLRYGTPIEQVTLLTENMKNSLKSAGIGFVGTLWECSAEDILRIPGLDRASVAKILSRLEFIEGSGPHDQRKDEYKTDVQQKNGGMQKLQELVGLEKVKKQVTRIAAFARMKQDMEQRGMAGTPIVLNMEFTGNPGTAKTTVARILAEVLHEIGILKSPEILEVGRAQLIAAYEGQTADQVRKVFEEASGRLLFIDEAYSLVEHYTAGSGAEGYGAEAISTIVQEMENHRNEIVVIFAGYPDKMKELFDTNPGLRSRVPFQINFPDYSAEELLEIVRLETAKRGFESCPEAERKVLSICRETAGYPDSGNGRFCRNLVDAAMLNFAERVYGGSETVKPERFVLSAGDFECPETMSAHTEPRRLGFCA